MPISLFRRAGLTPDFLEVAHEGNRFRVAVRRRATARRMTLRVSSATGEVILSLPERADLAAAERFAAAHGGWIAARLARVPERIAFEPGALIPLRAEPHRIVHWSAVPTEVVASRSDTGQPVIAVAGDAPRIPRRVRQFLEREARRDLAAAVGRHAAALSLPSPRLTLRDTRSRWGSCSGSGHLSFSWRLILAPPLVLDYLAAHEVAHLREMNHSHHFWRLTESLCPRTADAERWLKRHAAELHRYG